MKDSEILIVACAFKKRTETAITVTSERIERNLKTPSMNIENEILYIKNAIPDKYADRMVTLESYVTNNGFVYTKLSSGFLLNRILRKSCDSVIKLINNKVAKAVSSNIIS